MKDTRKEKINILAIEWYNHQDLTALKEYAEKTRFKIVDFEDVFKVKYDARKWFERFWTQIKRFHPKRFKVYWEYIINGLIRKNYVFGQENIRKLNVMSLSLEQFKEGIEKHQIRGILIHREDPWINNIVVFSKKTGIKLMVLNKEHVQDRDEIAGKYAKNLPFRCDLMFIGGIAGKKFWSNTYGCDPDKIKITGVPRFDKYIEPAKISRADFFKKINLDPTKKLIFFPSFNNHSVQNQYKINKKILNTVFKPTDLEYAWPQQVYYDWDLSKFKEEQIKVLYDVARENKDIQILIKLHPDMHPTTTFCVKHELIALRNKIDNFVAISGYDIGVDPGDIVYYSDLTIAYNSTMLLEAIILKKSILQPKWGIANKIKGVPAAEWNCCNSANSPKELKERILEIIKNGEDITQYERSRKKILEFYFYKSDGSACKRTFEEMDKIF
jgi:hypothetical protein